MNRLNTYCLFNYRKYILHIIIAQVIRSIVGTNGLRKVLLLQKVNIAKHDILWLFYYQNTLRTNPIIIQSVLFYDVLPTLKYLPLIFFIKKLF